MQYRVGEVLFGQGTTPVGKTTAVTGNLSINGTKVPTASFTADLTKVTSDIEAPFLTWALVATDGSMAVQSGSLDRN